MRPAQPQHARTALGSKAHRPNANRSPGHSLCRAESFAGAPTKDAAYERRAPPPQIRMSDRDIFYVGSNRSPRPASRCGSGRLHVAHSTKCERDQRTSSMCAPIVRHAARPRQPATEPPANRTTPAALPDSRDRLPIHPKRPHIHRRSLPRDQRRNNLRRNRGQQNTVSVMPSREP